jgi:hypothetical protein
MTNLSQLMGFGFEVIIIDVEEGTTKVLTTVEEVEQELTEREGK